LSARIFSGQCEEVRDWAGGGWASALVTSVFREQTCACSPARDCCLRRRGGRPAVAFRIAKASSEQCYALHCELRRVRLHQVWGRTTGAVCWGGMELWSLRSAGAGSDYKRPLGRVWRSRISASCMVSSSRNAEPISGVNMGTLSSLHFPFWMVESARPEPALGIG